MNRKVKMSPTYTVGAVIHAVILVSALPLNPGGVPAWLHWAVFVLAAAAQIARPIFQWRPWLCFAATATAGAVLALRAVEVAGLATNAPTQLYASIVLAALTWSTAAVQLSVQHKAAPK